jgi:hypothetical protein
MLVVDPNKRIDFDAFFNHSWFKIELPREDQIFGGVSDFMKSTMAEEKN